MRRSDKKYVPSLSSGWACGTGHVYTNRLTYNRQLNVMGRYCSTDFFYQDEPQWKDTWGTFYGSTPFTDGPEDKVAQVGGFRNPNPAEYWTPRGGPLNMVSLGSRGFMGVTTDLDTIGLINLRPNSTFHHQATYPAGTEWLNLKGNDVDMVAFPNLQQFGDAFLVGWADGVDPPRPGKFHVVQVDADHRFIGEIASFDQVSWHQDYPWSYVPESGCVVWGNAWLEGDPTWQGEFAQRRKFPETYTSELRITTICESTTSPSTCAGKVCTVPSECYEFPTHVCVDGQCAFQHKPRGSPCSVGRCDGYGVCQSRLNVASGILPTVSSVMAWNTLPEIATDGFGVECEGPRSAPDADWTSKEEDNQWIQVEFETSNVEEIRLYGRCSWGWWDIRGAIAEVRVSGQWRRCDSTISQDIGKPPEYFGFRCSLRGNAVRLTKSWSGQDKGPFRIGELEVWARL